MFSADGFSVGAWTGNFSRQYLAEGGALQNAGTERGERTVGRRCAGLARVVPLHPLPSLQAKRACLRVAMGSSVGQ